MSIIHDSPDAPLTAKQISAVVVRYFYPPVRWAACPNVTHGFGLSWEADVIAVSPSGITHEVEVKVSKYDLGKDSEKSKWSLIMQGPRELLDAFYVAVPKSLRDYALQYAGRNGAGVYVISNGVAEKVKNCEWKRRPLHVRRGNGIVGNQTMIWRLCSLRYWDGLLK